MKNRRLVMALLIAFFASFGFSASAAALETESAEQQLEIKSSPANPHHLEYFSLSENGEPGLLTEEELTTGFVPPPIELYRETFLFQVPMFFSQPAYYDLRDHNKVTAVRNQGGYGSCWAFATYASLESYLLIAEEVAHNFSENNMMRLSGFDTGPNGGGNYHMSAAYLARYSGPVNEADDPYAQDPAVTGLDPIKHIQKVEFLMPVRSAIKAAIMENGAVTSVQYWNDYYYNNTHSSYYYSGSYMANHAITIVGWDDNYSRDNFNSAPPGDGAWIVKNSWGAGFGEGGYFYISYNDAWSGRYATVFHNAEPTDNYNRIYQYDYLGWLNSYGYSADTAFGANIFTAEADEILTAVSTYAAAPGTQYEISIYTDISPGDPISGQLQATASGTLSRAGYHTVKLDQAALLSAGSQFSVVIGYTTPGYNFPLPVEDTSSGYSSAAEASPGQGFISSSGSSWADITNYQASASLCIKAFTNKIPYEITVSASPSAGGTVTGGGTFEEGTEITVTATANLDYQFVNWTENGTQVSTVADYAFTVEADRSLVANFALEDPPPPEKHAIAVTANPSAGGTVTGGGTFEEGTEITVTATANLDYQFVNWTENGTQVSTVADYAFTVEADRSLVANFALEDPPPPEEYAITVSANPSAGGTVTGGGTFEEGTEITVTATANSGYQFVDWTENGTQVSTAADYAFTVEADRSLVANFVLEDPPPPEEYAIAVTASPSAGGTVTGGGTFEEGTEITVTATANSDYQFVDWTENGTQVSTGADYAFTVEADRSLVANFEEVSQAPAPPPQPADYAITVSANPSAGGTVTGGGTFEEGTEITVTATANLDYQFVDWTEDGTAVSTDPAYIFTVEADRSLVANFEEVSQAPAPPPQPADYAITVSANPSAGGTVTGGGTFEEGTEITVTAAANSDYQFVNWTENGAQVSTNAAYTFTVEADRSLVANFAEVTYIPPAPSPAPPPTPPADDLSDDDLGKIRAELENHLDTYYPYLSSQKEFKAALQQNEVTKPQIVAAPGGKDIVFAAGWGGSVLKLSVYDPDGKLYGTVEGSDPPLELVVQKAQAGDWTFTVTAVDIPENNYPYVVLSGNFILGDINNDGRIDVNDLVTVMRHGLGLELIPADLKSVVDLNRDGKVDVIDVTLLMRRLLGLIDAFPI